MKIAISGDAFEVFTSGFPVRGMFIELLKLRRKDTFVVYYSRKCNNEFLSSYYKTIESFPNVRVRYLRDCHKVIVLKRMLGLPYIKFDKDVDCFINPGAVEYMRNYKGAQISVLTDLSTLHGYSTHKYAWFFKYWNKYYYKWAIPRLYLLNVISHFTKKDLLSVYSTLNESSINVIYNGIDDFWFDDYYAFSDLPSGLKNEKYFIWWGCVSRRKNIENLYRAYKLQKQKNPNLPKLLLIGNWLSYMNPVKELIMKDNNIIILPFQSNYVLKTLVKNSSGLVFPSYYEGYGLPVIEAFSQGVPVACSNVTSLPEIANNHAILFNPHDISDMASAMQLLYSKQRYDADSLKSYASKYTYYNMAKCYSLILDGIKK